MLGTSARDRSITAHSRVSLHLTVVVVHSHVELIDVLHRQGAGMGLLNLLE